MNVFSIWFSSLHCVLLSRSPLLGGLFSKRGTTESDSFQGNKCCMHLTQADIFQKLEENSQEYDKGVLFFPPLRFFSPKKAHICQADSKFSRRNFTNHYFKLNFPHKVYLQQSRAVHYDPGMWQSYLCSILDQLPKQQRVY